MGEIVSISYENLKTFPNLYDYQDSRAKTALFSQGRIADAGQEQAVGRNAGAGGAAVLFQDDLFKAFGGQLAPAHLQQGPHNGPDHIP